MPKTYTERAGERITLDYPVPVTRLPNARTGERPMDQVAAARLHEFHPAKPPHEQWMHGRRRAPGASAPGIPAAPKAKRARAPKPKGGEGEAKRAADRAALARYDRARLIGGQITHIMEALNDEEGPEHRETFVNQHLEHAARVTKDPAEAEMLRGWKGEALATGSNRGAMDLLRQRATEQGIDIVGAPDDEVSFRRGQYTELQPGTVYPQGKAWIIRPGVRDVLSGKVVEKPLVWDLPPETVLGQTAALERMHEFHPAPPPHVQSSHGNRGGRKAAAVPDAPKAVKAATRARAPKAATGKPKLGDLVRKQKPSDARTVAAANEIWGGTFGGLTAEVTEATPVHMNKSEKSLIIAGDIKDAKGNRIGTFTRSVSDKDGKLTASHSSLNLSPKVRGQGFAEAFNNNAIDWYRNNGVQEVHLYTTDVGGYAWARAGYDFASEESAQAIRMRVLEAADPGSTRNTDVGGKAAKIPKERLDEQRRLAGELFDRSEDAKFGEVGYPTPYEISQLGRWPGAGKDDMWIGKAIMLDSSWKGVRYL